MALDRFRDTRCPRSSHLAPSPQCNRTLRWPLYFGSRLALLFACRRHRHALIPHGKADAHAACARLSQVVLPIPLALICLAKPSSTASGNSHLSSSPSNPQEARPSEAPFPNSRWLALWPPSKSEAPSASHRLEIFRQQRERGSAQDYGWGREEKKRVWSPGAPAHCTLHALWGSY